MLIVGLTGGVASGKSTVARVLREEGACLIDADQIARELVQPQTPDWHALIRTFGQGILQQDGTIHRKRLASLIFSDPEKRDQLNRLLHPRIKEETWRRVRAIGQKDPDAIIIIDAALLVETGGYREMDRLIVVQADPRQQIERLKEREGLSSEEAQRILASQMPLEEKLKVADFVIRNEGSVEEAEEKTRVIFQELRRLALQKGSKGQENSSHRPKGGESKPS